MPVGQLPYLLPFLLGTVRVPAATGDGALTATATAVQFTVNPELSGTGSLSATAYATVTADLSGAGNLSAVAFGAEGSVVVVSGHGQLSATATMFSIDVAAELSGAGSLSATAATTEFAIAGTGTGSGVLTAATLQICTAISGLAGSGVLTAFVTEPPPDIRITDIVPSLRITTIGARFAYQPSVADRTNGNQSRNNVLVMLASPRTSTEPSSGRTAGISATVRVATTNGRSDYQSTNGQRTSSQSARNNTYVVPPRA